MDAQTIIEQLGGARKVSADLKVPLTTVRSWVDRNSIPPWRMPAVDKLRKRAAA
jgi:hypothetical protein